MALLSGSANGQTTFKREELRVPAPGAGKRGLQVLLVKPDLPGPLPLVLINHGSPRKPEDRRKLSPLSHLPQAIEFARRGWAAAVIMRRGMGESDGNVTKIAGTCDNLNLSAWATSAVSDIRSTLAHLQKRPDIDGGRLIVIGQSSGGFATVALAADPPPGLLAAISMAGGLFGSKDGKPCGQNGNQLVETIRAFGKRSRIPMLWIYTENDKIFPPQLARRMKDAFSAGGGKVEFIEVPSFRDDGHMLFSRGIRLWTPYVDDFLRRTGLVLLEKPLPVPRPIEMPKNLSENGRKMFEDFLLAPPNRALAVSPTRGAIGWWAGASSPERAKKTALEGCAKHASDCRIVVVNDEAVP